VSLQFSYFVHIIADRRDARCAVVSNDVCALCARCAIAIVVAIFTTYLPCVGFYLRVRPTIHFVHDIDDRVTNLFVIFIVQLSRTLCGGVYFELAQNECRSLALAQCGVETLCN